MTITFEQIPNCGSKTKNQMLYKKTENVCKQQLSKLETSLIG